MATKKVTITFPRNSSSAAEWELRRRVGRRLVADWQAEHGAFTAEELAAAKAELAAADAQAFSAAESVPSS